MASSSSLCLAARMAGVVTLQVAQMATAATTTF
jgi:hypothetical protein